MSSYRPVLQAPATLDTLHSNMRLAAIPQVEALNERFDELGGVMLGFALGEDDYQGYTDIINSVAEVPGMHMLEQRDAEVDELYQCMQFVFGAIGGAKWARPFTEIDEAIMQAPVPFLKRRWYDLVERPNVGDVVAYSTRPLDDIIDEYEDARFGHFGILLPDANVVSKFGAGSIFEHNIHAVPDAYGLYASFFRKRRRQPQAAAVQTR